MFEKLVNIWFNVVMFIVVCIVLIFFLIVILPHEVVADLGKAVLGDHY